MDLHGISTTNPGAEASSPNNPKLTSAAHEFEASLMKEFLEPLEHDSLFSESKTGETDDSEGSADALMSFGSQAMAKAISERGGFGIATMILNHFRTGAGAVNADNASGSHGITRREISPITKVLNAAADK